MYLIPDLQNKALALVGGILDLVLVSSSQGVPAAPNRPIAQERSCTSVILRWLPPSSTGNCTISGYTVEYREEGKWFELCSLAQRMRTKSPLWLNRSEKHPCHHWSVTSCCSQIPKSKAKRSPSIIQSNFLYITDLSVFSSHLWHVKCAKLKHIHHQGILSSFVFYHHGIHPFWWMFPGNAKTKQPHYFFDADPCILVKLSSEIHLFLNPTILFPWRIT